MPTFFLVEPFNNWMSYCQRQEMEVRSSCIVKFIQGRAELAYPDVLKRMEKSTISCLNLHTPGIASLSNQLLFITCEGSYFRDENFDKSENILAMFQMKRKGHLHNFLNYSSFPLSTTPQNLKLKIVNSHKEVKNVSGIGVFHIVGTARDKQLLI